VEALAEDPTTANQFSDLVIASGMSDKIAKRVIEHFKRGAQDVERLERWWFARQVDQLSSPVVEELLRLQLDDGRGSLWSNAIHLCHAYFLEKGNEKPLPESLVFELLTHTAMTDGRVAHSASYYWSRLAAAFLKQCPGRKWDLFQSVLLSGVGHWAVLADLNTNEEHVLTHLLREDPETAFDCVTDVYSQVDDRSTFGIQHWLSDDGHRGIEDDGPGPIQYIPAAKLFAWVDADIDRRGYWLARTLPKTLDDTAAGRLTRDFIARYSQHRSIASGLHEHFHSRGWCGNASDRYRELREQSRTWLVNEKDKVVIRWVENYMDGLTYDIARAEIDEERRL